MKRSVIDGDSVGLSKICYKFCRKEVRTSRGDSQPRGRMEEFVGLTVISPPKLLHEVL